MTTMTDIDHVVFDIGQILIHYDPNIPFKRIIPDAGERQWFFDTVCTSPWNANLQTALRGYNIST